VRTLKLAAPIALLISMLVVSASFAAPACCDPKNSSSSGGSFLPGPSVNRSGPGPQAPTSGLALNQPPVSGGCCGANRPAGFPGCAAGGQGCCPGAAAQDRGPVSAIRDGGKMPQGQVYQAPTVVPISRITGATTKAPDTAQAVGQGNHKPAGLPRSAATKAGGSPGSTLW